MDSMNIVLLTTASDISKTKMLQKSLIKYGWPYHIIQHVWAGFGGKILNTYHYLKAHPEITHFFYTDSYDTMVLATMEETVKKIKDFDCILLSAERACYPHPDKEARYPKHESPWHFVNGGGWFCNAELFIRMVDQNPLKQDDVDQVWFTDLFLNYPQYVKLDYNCEVFQTISSCPESDFKIILKDVWDDSDDDPMTPPNGETAWNVVYNTVTNSYPTFFHGNGHTPLTRFYELLKSDMNTLNDLQAGWEDTKESHKAIHELFIEKTNADPKLKEFRDHVEAGAWGFGERSFMHLWKLIVQTQKPDFKFLEIGVYRGQTLALVRMLAPKATIYGITPLDPTGGFHDSDYEADIKTLHKHFKLKQPGIIKGLSTTPEIIDEARHLGPYDIIYIDGGHSYEVAKSDVYLYSSMVNIGGYLVIDDCAHKYKLPEGMFPGIDTVSMAVDELLPNEFYEEIASVVHIRIFKRIK